jgi:hypothetical protein
VQNFAISESACEYSGFVSWELRAIASCITSSQLSESVAFVAASLLLTVMLLLATSLEFKGTPASSANWWSSRLLSITERTEIDTVTMHIVNAITPLLKQTRFLEYPTLRTK